LYYNFDEYTNKLTALKKKIQKRDEILLDYDKYKTQLIKLTAKQVKDPIKQGETEKKFEEIKELYKKTNEELIEEIRIHYEEQYSDFKSQYKQLITSQAELYKAASNSFKALIELPPIDATAAAKTRKNLLFDATETDSNQPVTKSPPPTTGSAPPKKEISNLTTPSSQSNPQVQVGLPPPSLPKKDSASSIVGGPPTSYPQERNPFEVDKDTDALSKPPSRPPPIPPKQQ